jgi:hypothetical protein
VLVLVRKILTGAGASPVLVFSNLPGAGVSLVLVRTKNQPAPEPWFQQIGVTSNQATES